jgi:hypothetical protein
MRKSLKNKLVTGTAIAGFGLTSLLGPSINPVRADDKSLTEDMVEDLREIPLTGVPIRILEGIFGGNKNKETHIHIHKDEEERYQKKEKANIPQQREQPRYQRQEKSEYEKAMDELPLIFTCGGKANNITGFKEIGKQIFYTDEKIYVAGKEQVNYLGKEITNLIKCLTTGEQADGVVKKATGIHRILCTFDANSGYLYYQKNKGIDVALYENIWYADGKKIGSVNFIIVKKSTEDKFLKNSNRLDLKEIPNNYRMSPTDERTSHGEMTSGKNY